VRVYAKGTTFSFISCKIFPHIPKKKKFVQSQPHREVNERKMAVLIMKKVLYAQIFDKNLIEKVCLTWSICA
jgi:hypothetical protein